MKPSILFILHMPPPVHGAAMMGKYIHDSKMINETFDCHYINLATAKDIKDIGKVGLKKLISFLEMLKSIRKMVKQIKHSWYMLRQIRTELHFIKSLLLYKC